MSETVTVKSFAKSIGIEPGQLLKQLNDAGIVGKQDDDVISAKEKLALLSHLREKHGKEDSVEPDRVTLKRRKVSEIQLADPLSKGGYVRSRSSKGKVVNVEYRQKRTYIKRSSVEEIQRQQRKQQEEEATRLKQEADQKLVDAGSIADRQSQQDNSILSDATKTASVGNQDSNVDRVELTQDAVVNPVSKEQASKQQEIINNTGATEVLDASKEGKSTPSQAQEISEKAATATDAVVDAKKEPSPAPVVTDSIATKSDKPDALNAEKKTSKKANNKKTGGAKEEGLWKEKLHVSSATTRRRKKRTVQSRRVTPSASNSPKVQEFEKPDSPVSRQVEVPEQISVADLAHRLSVKSTEVIKLMMRLGSMVTINERLDRDTATLVIEEFGHKAKFVKDRGELLEEQVAGIQEQDDTIKQVTRPPVVTIMGHVDHGKTSLLDAIRNTKVAASESGNITQHIGAYQVITKDNGKVITFLDTPGHAAFTAMRARGSQVTDIVVLIIAADDGVMPQTVEAIQHAKAAEVPVIVAINKIDKPDANPEKIEQELAQHNIVLEKWGGEVSVCKVSAHSGEGIDHLLEVILLQSEMLELTAPASGNALGIVIESQLDKGRGPTQTVLVQRGCLQRGDMVLCGPYVGRVKSMRDEHGKEIQKALPSSPVQIQGLSGLADVGSEMIVVQNEKKAREIADLRETKRRERKLAQQQSKTADAITQMSADGTVKMLNILIRADVQGSAEAIAEASRQIESEAVQVNIVSVGIGAITESDANLAFASNCIILGFNVRADASARRLIEENKLELRYYSVIYELLDDVHSFCDGLLDPDVREEIMGVAEVRDVFHSPKLGNIAGCMVVSGLIKRNNPIRILRDNVVIYEGNLESLRRFKEDANEVKNGTECGIGVKNYNDIKVGDNIEVFKRITVPVTTKKR